MKKLSFVLLALLLLAALAACGGKEVTAKKPINEIYGEITSAVTLPEMLSLSDDTLYAYVGIQSGLYKSFVAAIPLSATSGDMLFIFEANDAQSAGEIKTKLENFLAQKTVEMKDYIPSEYEKLTDSSVTAKGRYVWLVVSDNAQAILNIINDNIK